MTETNKYYRKLFSLVNFHRLLTTKIEELYRMGLKCVATTCDKSLDLNSLEIFWHATKLFMEKMYF